MICEDLDADGHLDLAGVNFESGTLTVWYGDGTGQFTQPFDPIPVGDFPTDVAVSKTSGEVDAFFVTSSTDDTVRIIENNGRQLDNSSQPPIENVGERPLSISAGDFDGDGMDDFVVLSQRDASVHLLNSSNGYESQQIATVGNGPTQVTVADLNGDGLDDLAVSGGTREGKTGISLGFQTETDAGRGFDFNDNDKATTNPIIALATADVDNDGATDLIAAQAGLGEFPLLVLANDGEGVFTESTLIGSGAFPDTGVVYSLETSNTGGSVDFLLANYESNSLTVVSNELSSSSAAIFINQNINVDTTEFVFLVEDRVNAGCGLVGDADGDCQVGFSDFLILSMNFGQASGENPFEVGDFDANGIVGFGDFLILSMNFGQIDEAS